MSARSGWGGARDLAWLVLALGLPVPWLGAGAVGAAPEAGVVATLSGLAILGAAFLLSWSTELAERDVPQSLALLVLALVSVLPEYAVDLHFAIRAATEPRYAGYAVANMTGANRLLIGLGWSAVVLLSCARRRESHLTVAPHQRLEIRFLLLATLWSFTIPLGGHLDLVDSGVLLALFGGYVVAASRGAEVEVELVGPAAWLDARCGDAPRRLLVLALLAYGALAIWLSAEPFAEGLVELGQHVHVDEFLLVQWVAPLASESPEFVVALLFAWRLRGTVGLGALISSKVNQWTLLVGALPVAFLAAGGGLEGIPLDARQREELWLTSAQSLLATVVVADLRVSRLEAVLLASLFAVQLVFPSTEVRLAFAVLYVVVALGLVVHSGERRAGLRGLLRR